MLAAAVVSGGASYVYLIVVAQAVGPIEYSTFSLFWSLAVITGLGLFLPVEQELARLGSTATSTGRRPLGLVAGVTVLVVVLAALAASAAVIALSGAPTADAGLLVMAVAGALVGYGMHYPVRGVLSGLRSLSRYAIVLAAEGALRILLALVVALLVPDALLALSLVVALAAAGSALPFLWTAIVGLRGVRTSWLSFGAGVGRLVVAALVVQLLLNFPPVVAFLASDGGDTAIPGVLLAALTLARIPVFVYQAMQAAVIPSIAAHAARGESRRARRLAFGAAGAGFVAATLWTAVLALLGPAGIRLLFGERFAVDSTTLVLVGAAVGTLLVAIILSDSVTAVGGHGAASVIWVVAGTLAVVGALVSPDVVVASTLPVALAAALAAVALALVLGARTRRAAGRMDADEDEGRRTT